MDAAIADTGLLALLKQRLRRELFLPTALSLVISPIYIIRRGLYRAISEAAPAFTGDVLDFGCGSKPYEGLFVNARSYTGVDIAVSGHDHADSRIDFLYDGKTLPFADNSFDAVVAFEVFEHVFNIDEVLTEIRRVLRPGGKIMLSIPFAWDEHEEPYDFARYTSFGISHILDRQGYAVTKISKTTTYVLAVAQISIAYLARHVAPRRGIMRRIFQLAVIFPLNILALGANAILPKRYEFYCNIVATGTNTKPA